jgi:hypothetical protein
MADVSILDLFWLILKFLAALGLVCLIFFVVYIIGKLVFRFLLLLPRMFSGEASTGLIVGWVLVIVAVISLVFGFGANWLDTHPSQTAR